MNTGNAAGLEEVLDAERKVWGFKQFAPLAEARNPRSGFIGQEGLLTLQARKLIALMLSTRHPNIWALRVVFNIYLVTRCCQQKQCLLALPI